MCYVIVCVMLWVIVSVWCFLSVTLCVNVRVHITVTHKPSFAQGDQLSNHANPNTLQWGTLRENLDKLERDIHEKGIPLMKTWRYMHSQFPDTLLYKDCRMGLLEVNTGFRFNIDFKTEEREPVKEIMSKLPPMTSSV